MKNRAEATDLPTHPEFSPGRLRVLLVEDSNTDRHGINNALKPHPCHVTKVRNMAQAQKVLAGGCEYDAMLLDIDRREITEEQIAELAREMPVLVLSRRADQTLAIHMMEVGVEDYLCDEMLELDPIVLCHALQCAVCRFRHMREELDKKEEIIHENEQVLGWLIGNYMK